MQSYTLTEADLSGGPRLPSPPWFPVPVGAHSPVLPGGYPAGWAVREPDLYLSARSEQPRPGVPAAPRVAPEAERAWGRAAREIARAAGGAPWYESTAARAARYGGDPWDLLGGLELIDTLIDRSPRPPSWWYAPSRSDLLVEGRRDLNPGPSGLIRPPAPLPEVEPSGSWVVPAWELDRAGGPLGDAYGRTYAGGLQGPAPFSATA